MSFVQAEKKGSCSISKSKHRIGTEFKEKLMTEEFEIVNNEGKKFCMCRYDEGGNPVLVTKNGAISINRLMLQAYGNRPNGNTKRYRMAAAKIEK